MHIGFYNPYLDGLGGGERYTLTLASHWSLHHSVDLFWDDPSIITSAQDRFGLDLSHVRVVPNIFDRRNFFSKLKESASYDCVFMLTDGSIPTSLARHTILHFQVPFPKVVANQFAMGRVSAVVCNSMFTKKYIDPRMSKISTVIYPPIQPILHNTRCKKESVILSVGRFTSDHHAKKQDVMIDAFIKMESKLSAWSLVLVGGLLSSDAEYFDMLKQKSRGHRVFLYENMPYAGLVSLYNKASIYWHGAGFEEHDPQYMEHFGITTVEAASAGAVPIVFAGGGQAEIVGDNENGMLWQSTEELIYKTTRLIADGDTYQLLQKNAKVMWKRYGTKVFTDSYDRILQSL